MEATVGQLIGQQTSELMTQRGSLPDSSQKMMLIEKYGERSQFLTTYNPSYQREVVGTPDECYFGDYPTLAQLKGYGKNTPVAWLVPQLYNLSEYCGCKDKLQGVPLEECAFTISTEFYWLKVSELMLFFHRFKSGKYGRFYGSVDPLVITTSLREFLQERGVAYEKHYREEKEREERGRTKGVSWEEYCKRNGIKGRATVFSQPQPPKKENKQPTESVEEIIKIAKSLLTETNKTVVEAFGRIFKKKHGCTPEEYIKQHKED